MMRTKAAPVSAILALAIVSASCAGTEAESTELTVTVQEFQFTPSAWTVPAGEEISIEITNQGAVTHEWVLMQEGVTITSEAELPETEEELLANFVNVEEEVEVGQTNTLTFQAPPPGTYQVICAIEGHFDAGMEGTLTSTG